MRARLRVAVTPGDVGRRVTLRARTHAPPGEPPFTDTVGVLLSWEHGRLTVRRRGGEVVTVLAADLVAGRVVPPSPRAPRR